MNSKVLTCVAGCLGLIGLSACDDTWEPKTEQEGTLNMTGLGIDVSEIEKVISIETAPKKVESRAENYDVNNFIVRITDATGAAVEEWSYATTPEVATLKPGSYKLEIHSHDVQPAEWEKPYFHVSKDFTIVGGAIERIGTLTARLSNSAVSIRFDDELRKMAANDVVVEVKANDEGVLTYTLDEVRKGYFKIIEGSTSMIVNFRGTINGYKEDITLPTTDLEAGQHRIITFKAKINPNTTPDETGTIDPTSGVGIDVSVTDEDVDGQITLEEDVEVVKPEDRPGYQEPQDPPVGPVDPEKPIATFTPGEDLNIEGVNDYNEFGDGSELAPGTKQALVSINCPEKFAKIEVDIVSDYLTEEFLSGVGLSTHFDLAHPGAFETALTGFGFPVNDGVIGQTDVDFNITTLVPLLALSGDPDMVHKFVITVTDQNNQKATPLTLLFAGHN